jgi:hypothetical protein
MQLKPRIMSDYKPYCCVRPRNVKLQEHKHYPRNTNMTTGLCNTRTQTHTLCTPPSPPKDEKKLMGFEPTTPT